MKYEVILPGTGVVVGERSNVKEARRLARKYEGAVVRVKQHPAIKSVRFDPEPTTS